MRKFLTAAAACALLTAPAFADELPCRASWTDMQAKLSAPPTAAKIAELPAAQRAIAQANFNATPPASDEIFSHIYAATSAAHPDVMLVIFARTDDCVVLAAGFAPEDFAKLLTPHSVHEKGDGSDKRSDSGT